MRILGTVVAASLASAAVVAQSPAASRQARTVVKPAGTLAQVMRGIYFRTRI
jgi:hypothetical protein